MRVWKAVFAVCVLLVLAGLAGCSGERPPREPTITEPDIRPPNVTASTTTATPVSIDPSAADSQQGATVLERQSRLSIESIAENNDTILVVFETVRPDAPLDDQYIYLGDKYASVVNETWAGEETWNVTRMDLVAVDANGSRLGSTRITAYWGHQVKTDAITAATFKSRLRATSDAARADGSIPSHTDEPADFEATLDAETDVSKSAVEQRGNTLFLTVGLDANGTAAREDVVTEVASAYGTFKEAGGNTTALELTVRGTDTDLLGWYRIDAGQALGVASGNQGSIDAVLATYYPEDDRLEP